MSASVWSCTMLTASRFSVSRSILDDMVVSTWMYHISYLGGEKQGEQSLDQGPQIYKGDPRLRLPPREIASSAMRLKLGYVGFCRKHTQKRMRPQPLCAVSACVYLHTDIRTWRTTVILITGETRIPPIWAPCQDKNGTGSGISLVYLCQGLNTMVQRRGFEVTILWSWVQCSYHDYTRLPNSDLNNCLNMTFSYPSSNLL